MEIGTLEIVIPTNNLVKIIINIGEVNFLAIVTVYFVKNRRISGVVSKYVVSSFGYTGDFHGIHVEHTVFGARANVQIKLVFTLGKVAGRKLCKACFPTDRIRKLVRGAESITFSKGFTRRSVEIKADFCAGGIGRETIPEGNRIGGIAFKLYKAVFISKRNIGFKEDIISLSWTRLTVF